ncbi:GNAT family N-acetyltransferase [Bernardetia sp. OM2101]|uniref:GNAT family N-acetyltransferase n=1 Tax=Bernardetia sp. OM2101 TaxID=3344876 RepID=UPI0035CF664E
MQKIRIYTEKDKNQLIKLIQLNTPTYFDSSEEEEFVEYLDKHKEDYFVIKDEVTNQIVGCGGINYFFNNDAIDKATNSSPNLARISWDIIHPDFQGLGIGKKLLLYRINHIKSKEINLIIVRTSQLAYKFYQKVGFELEKVEKDFWAKGFDLYQMKMSL